MWKDYLRFRTLFSSTTVYFSIVDKQHTSETYIKND